MNKQISDCILRLLLKNKKKQMPVYLIKCPDCEHQFKTLVMANTQEPKEWVCSMCGSHQAKPIFQYISEHPLENSHGAGCPCCGGISK